MSLHDLRESSCIVIPAYNAERFLEPTLRTLLPWVEPGRIAVVDDGSNDGTSEAAKRSGVACLRHEKNLGKGSAVMTGMRWAAERGWEWAVTMDADGQHAAADLESFWTSPVTLETAMVVGRRERNGDMPWHRRFSNALTTRMISRLAGAPVYDAQCGYRMYRVRTALDVLPALGRFEWEAQALVLCRRRGFSVLPASVATLYTGNGSHMRLFADTLRFLRMYGRLAWTR